MAFKINSSSGFSAYQLNKSQTDLNSSLNRLSTGRRINAASDDASGMVIANRLASQAAGYGQAIKNASDAVAITQVADGALGQATELILDIRVKSIQAASAAQSPESLQAIQADINGSLNALNDIAQNTSYNGQKLLSGSFDGREFQIGASAGNTVEISLQSIEPSQISDENLGTFANIDVTTQEGAQAAIQLSDVALETVSAQRSKIGSTQNQLTSSISNLTTSRINTLSAESDIRDVDFAQEAGNLKKIELLTKVRAFALAQSNANAGRILDIFK